MCFAAFDVTEGPVSTEPSYVVKMVCNKHGRLVIHNLLLVTVGLLHRAFMCDQDGTSQTQQIICS